MMRLGRRRQDLERCDAELARLRGVLIAPLSPSDLEGVQGGVIDWEREKREIETEEETKE